MSSPILADYVDDTDDGAEILAGLCSTPKTLPCKLFYDAVGSELFERICELPEYYPTRTEIGILRGNIASIADRIGPGAMLIEYGSGASVKTRILLDHLREPAAYVPIDISREMLVETAHVLHASYPDLEILPVCADYTADYALPAPAKPGAHPVFFYPGSTIGNFEPAAAAAFLGAMRAHIGADTHGGLLIGVDLRKDPAVLEAAYDDAAGVTAEFNLNVLARLNREHGADFDLKAFDHRALYNEVESRIEMYLVSREDQEVRVAGGTVEFAAGETICTEYSYKYGLADFAELATRAAFRVAEVWTDEDRLFSVQYLEIG